MPVGRMCFRHYRLSKLCLKSGPTRRRNHSATRYRQTLARKIGTAETKLAGRIVKDVMEVLHYGEESVSLSFEEIKPQDWKEKVYQPDIQDNWEKIYKKPGYEM